MSIASTRVTRAIGQQPARAVEALVVPAERLRALLIAEAELGEQIMRALILRRVGLIEEGAGPIIVGRAAQAGVLRLQGFLARNGQPYHHVDPDIDEVARALIEHFHVTERWSCRS